MLRLVQPVCPKHETHKACTAGWLVQPVDNMLHLAGAADGLNNNRNQQCTTSWLVQPVDQRMRLVQPAGPNTTHINNTGQGGWLSRSIQCYILHGWCNRWAHKQTWKTEPTPKLVQPVAQVMHVVWLVYMFYSSQAECHGARCSGCPTPGLTNMLQPIQVATGGCISLSRLVQPVVVAVGFCNLFPTTTWLVQSN